MSCTFSIPFSSSPEDVLARAKKAVTGQGGSFEGDTKTGSFHLSVFGSTIAGSYIVNGQELNIVIDKKPFLASCGMIEGYLKKEIQ